MRLSLGGRAVAFGEAQLQWRGPTAVSAALCGESLCGGSPSEPAQDPAAPEKPDSVCVKFAHVGGGGIVDMGGKFLLVGPLFELGYSDGSWRNATSSVSGAAKDTVVVTALTSAEEKTPVVTMVRYAQYNEPCDPSNDHPGMSPGGGGEHGARPTLGNMSATFTCSLYSRYPGGGEGAEGVLLPAPSFWLNVTQ